MATIKVDLIVRESLVKKQLGNKMHNNLDDYFRLISSPSGRYLVSISNTKKLTIFDTEKQVLIQSFSEQNVTFCAFSEDETILAITTRKPSIKLYKVIVAQDTLKKQLQLLQQLKPSVVSNVYGWIVPTIDNKHFIFTRNQEIFALDMNNFEERLLSMNDDIRNKCAPYFMIMDRQRVNLVTSSRTGQICKFSISFEEDGMKLNDQNSWPQINLVQSISLSPQAPLLTISDMNQSGEFILVSTSKVTPSVHPYYNTFLISKQNIQVVFKIRLQQQMIAPPITILSDNVQSYLFAFLKGERTLYLYDLALLYDESKKLIKSRKESPGTKWDLTDIKQVEPIWKQQMGYLMHGINYNRVSGNLVMGVSNVRNEDKLIFLEVGFDCSSITNDSSKDEQNIIKTFKSTCQQQSYQFSPAKRQCVVRSEKQLENEKNCSFQNKIQQQPTTTSRTDSTPKNKQRWNDLGKYCQLLCHNVPHSVSKLPYSLDLRKCYCKPQYKWNGNISQCAAVAGEKDNFNAIDSLDQTSDKIINQVDQNEDNGSTVVPLPQKTASGQVGVAVGVIFGVVVFIAVIMLVVLYFYKKKKLCFKQSQSQQTVKSSAYDQRQIKEIQSANKKNQNIEKQRMQEVVQQKKQDKEKMEQNESNYQKQQQANYDQINIDSQRNFSE